MKIVCMVLSYPPLQNAGAEWMLHEMMKHLASHGHTVDVLVPINSIEPYEFEGVNVRPDIWKDSIPYLKGCDIIVSHLDRAGRALNCAVQFKKKFLEVVHNTNRHGLLYYKTDKIYYVVYNSLFTKNTMKYPCPGIVVHPPVDAKRYKVVKKGSKLTLINLYERKGGLFFQQLARLMPDRDFLGVEGGYGKQEKVNLPNVAYIPHTKDIKAVYAKTRILLMPSLYESYGRTAVEAMCSGIPVIAAPTTGLKESLGDAGIFCDLNEQDWVDAITKLDDPEEYKAASKKCLERFKEISLQSPLELAEMEKFMTDIAMHQI